MSSRAGGGAVCAAHWCVGVLCHACALVPGQCVRRVAIWFGSDALQCQGLEAMIRNCLGSIPAATVGTDHCVVAVLLRCCSCCDCCDLQGPSSKAVRCSLLLLSGVCAVSGCCLAGACVHVGVGSGFGGLNPRDAQGSASVHQFCVWGWKACCCGMCVCKCWNSPVCLCPRFAVRRIKQSMWVVFQHVDVGVVYVYRGRGRAGAAAGTAAGWGGTEASSAIQGLKALWAGVRS